MAASATAYSGSVPENYDRYLGPLLFEPFAQDLVARIGLAAPPPPGVLSDAGASPDKNVLRDVLEIASGTGRLTRHLRASLPASVRLEAMDISSDMTAIARLLLPDEAIEWRTGDAQDLPYPDGSFDLVICQFGIMFIPDKAKALAGFFRVLRPGGRLLLNTWNTIESNKVVHTASETIDRFFPDQPRAFFRSPFSFHDQSLIISLIRGAGFSDISMDLLKLTGTSPSAAEAAMGLIDGAPIIGFILEQAPELLTRIRENVEKEISERYGNTPLQSPLEAWVAEARKK